MVCTFRKRTLLAGTFTLLLGLILPFASFAQPAVTNHSPQIDIATEGRLFAGDVEIAIFYRCFSVTPPLTIKANVHQTAAQSGNGFENEGIGTISVDSSKCDGKWHEAALFVAPSVISNDSGFNVGPATVTATLQDSTGILDTDTDTIRIIH